MTSKNGLSEKFDLDWWLSSQSSCLQPGRASSSLKLSLGAGADSTFANLELETWTRTACHRNKMFLAQQELHKNSVQIAICPHSPAASRKFF